MTERIFIVVQDDSGNTRAIEGTGKIDLSPVYDELFLRSHNFVFEHPSDSGTAVAALLSVHHD